MEPPGPDAEDLLARLRAMFRVRGAVVVGFSGGVDSALLAAAAHDALGPRALSVTVDSPSLARAELRDAEALARQLGLRWQVAQAREMLNPLYVANPENRCFFCREEMSSVLLAAARREGHAAVAMGVNGSDLSEHRPGHAAMRAAGVWMPLLELGADKGAVRAMARARGLPVADKPSMACLSSRVRHGDPISEALLRRIEDAEGWLRARGFRVVRVRALGGDARIEVGQDELARLRGIEPEARAALRALGFGAVEVDPRGYRPGSMSGPQGVPARGP